jgi:RNA polymerase sigma factor (sigma-70 family)
MSGEVSFHQVLDELRRRDEEAARCVYNRFVCRLVGLARGHLEKRIQRGVDPEDVAQSVFKSVFHRLADGQFVLTNWDSMWALLATVTVHKCRKWADYYHAQARDVSREVPAQTDDSNWRVIDREPSPSEALVFAETAEQVLEGLEEHEQGMVALSMQGFSVNEISARLGCSYSKVYRVLRLIRQRIERLCETSS